MSFGQDFLTVAAVLLGFDFIIGLTTYGRIAGANADDLRAVHGMARIRHSYTQIAPGIETYFTTPIHDDVESVLGAYGGASTSAFGDFLYALTTSGGMIGLIVAMVGGVFAAVLALLLGIAGGLAVWIGIGGGVLVFAALVAFTFGAVPRHQASLGVRFPARQAAAGGAERSTAPDDAPTAGR
jgi:hypothetical protein